MAEPGTLIVGPLVLAVPADEELPWSVAPLLVVPPVVVLAIGPPVPMPDAGAG
jgi:hypothetical protein